jgi:anti-repressor protein
MQSKIADQSRQLEEQKPKVEFADTIATSSDVLSWNDFAKVIGIGRNTMLRRLREFRILNARNVPYQSYLDRDYFEVTETKTPVGIQLTTRVTGKGQYWLTKKLT